MRGPEPDLVDHCRMVVRTRQVTARELARMLELETRTVQRWVYSPNVAGDTEPPVESPEENWWMRGDDHHHSKLTPDQVEAIWMFRDLDYSAPDVIRSMGLDVEPSAIYKIWRGQNWAWLTEALP